MQIQKIRAVAKELGYRPHAGARAMAQGAFNCIGLLLSTGRYRSSLPNSLLDGIEGALAQQDKHLLVARLPDERLTDDRFVPKALRELMCDGLLINYHAAIPQRMIDLIEQYELPSIWINVDRDSDSVRPDDAGAGREATERLLGAGHRNIVYLDANWDRSEAAGTLHYSRRARFDGHCAALREAGLSAHRLADRNEGPACYQQRLHALLTAPQAPTAVVCYSGDEITLLREVAYGLGLQLPRQLSTIVFQSEGSIHSSLCRDSAMVVPESKMGQTAVNLLMQRIAAPQQHVAAHMESFTFLDRGTIAPPVRGEPQ